MGWISRLVVFLDWLLSLVVDDLYADLGRAEAEAEGRETARQTEEKRLLAEQKRAQADIDRARADADRAAAERERARSVTPTPPGGEAHAAAEFDRLLEED